MPDSYTRVAVTGNVFPTTMKTWIDHRLDGGAEGLQAVREHIMQTYAWPLRVYFLGSSYQNLGEPDDIINGFLADRMSRPDFLRKWSQSGLRLRRWLANGLLFYLREEIKRRKRDAHAAIEVGSDGSSGARAPRIIDELALTGDPDIDIDRAAAVAFVQQAIERTRAKCEQQKLGQHWDAFLEHHLRDQSVQDIAASIGATPARTAVMIRTARRHFRNALREVLERDGVESDEVDQEIQELLAVAS